MVKSKQLFEKEVLELKNEKTILQEKFNLTEKEYSKLKNDNLIDITYFAKR